MAHIGSHLVAVCDVQRVHVRGKHGGALQLCGQGPRLRFFRDNAPTQLYPKLPVRACKVRYTCEIIPNPLNRLNQMVELYYNEINRGTFECFLEKHYTQEDPL